MICPRCLNEDNSYFYLGSKGYYCRKCIAFKRILIEEELNIIEVNEIKDDAHEYILKYPLTQKQKEISRKCVFNIDKNDVLIEAVCGAGKTEIVIETISYFLKQKKKVCFAISRRQVVLEVGKRLQEIFINSKVVSVCQGSTSELDGDLIVCTTHQCYRYYKVFDCLILDEPDAFPYKDNIVLRNIVRTSCKNNMVYLTATIDNYLKKRIKDNTIVHLKLDKRPHGHDLIVPKVYIGSFIFVKLINWLNINKEKSCLVFFPTIKLCEKMYLILKSFYKVDYCHSKLERKDEVIENFRNKKIPILFSTTILERGITINNINVCVYNSDHSIFDLASLIQMSGRVGRSFEHPFGQCLFLSKTKNKNVDDCIRICLKANNG
ncbi:MAG: DEAD/DEAH box helicase family protein [Erysipelotrichaceae bacterium]|nr:DEAD/DEAH box helicase family protein [Erysipelotrichaceae bacterium]